MQHSRKKSVRAVFLITDGYSNGGDPRPAAELLKSLNVHIFTFGIRNGNVKELRDMASDPKDEHSYILDSFQEFEALARRALHEGDYQVNFSPVEKTKFSEYLRGKRNYQNICRKCAVYSLRHHQDKS